MRKADRNYFIFAFVAIIVLLIIIGFIAVTLFSTPRRRTIQIAPSVTPAINFKKVDMKSIVLPATPTKTPLNNPNKSKVISQLPIITDGYTIEYLSTSDTFMILIKKSPYDTYRNKAIEWFQNHGISDLTTINTEFYQSRFLQK